MTPLASDQGRVLPAAPLWRGLTEAPETLLDVAATAAALDAAAAAAEDRAAIRPAVVAILRRAYAEGRAAIAAEIAASPREAHRAIHDYAWLIDRIVTLTLDVAHRWLHPLSNPTASERICAIAVGGYGRAEMAPFSDVDLLFITPYKQTPWGESLIESVLYCLWDLRLKVGHSVRTIDDCLRFGKADVTIRTSLLEHRYLWGEQSLAIRLGARLWEYFATTGPEFVELKLAERAERHHRQGSSRYLLEPNVKEGKGGLRDLQTLFWIAKYLNRAQNTDDLVQMGVFTPEEYRIFAEAEAFLWTARIHLHLLNGRASEQLTFDTQVEIAATLGYRSTEGQRAVERFMQDYFTHAKHVGDLTRIFLAALEARHVKSRPSLGEKLRNVLTFGKDPTGRAYHLKHGRLDLVDEGAFRKDPGEHPAALRGGPLDRYPDPSRRPAAGGGEPRPDRRQGARRPRGQPDLPRPAARPQQSRSGRSRLMNEVGVLGAFIPEFGRIVAMMQFNMYHYYTVDEHIIRTISTLSQIERKELVDDLPVTTDIVARGVEPAGALRGAAAARHRQGVGARSFHGRRRGGGAAGAALRARRRGDPSWWSGWCRTTS